jgi:MoaA/NifB/PqqE/SkfB family radical SAM enzyme
MDEKIKRLTEWARGKKAPPLTLELNITNRCNLLCKMCWLRSAKLNYDEEMKDEKLFQIVDEAIELGVKEFRFPGSGEPLMRKEVLFKLMERVKESGRSGLLISNGTLFSEEDVKKIVDMEWDVLTISLDGPSPEINDYIRGVEGSFKKTVKTLDLIKKWKMKSKKDYPWMRMNTVLTKRNYDKLEEMIELADKFGFEEFLLQPMTVFSREGEKIKVEDAESVNRHLESAGEKAKKLGIKTNVESFIRNIIVEKTSEMEKIIEEEIKKFDKKFLSVPCYEPFYNLIVMPDGKVSQCAIAGGKSEINLKNSSLKEVWFEQFEEFRKKLLNKELFPFCSHCCIPIFLENKRLRKELAKVI